MGERRRQKRAAARAAARAVKDAGKTTTPPSETKPTIVPKLSRRRIQLRKARRKATTIFFALVALVGLLGAYVLRPDISIEPYATTDPTRPFQQQFFVQNMSVYSLHQVHPMCGFGYDSNFVFRGLSLSIASENVETLEPGAKTTLTCSIGTGPIQYEINIVPWARYTVPFGIHLCKAAKFKGKPATGGTYIWTYNGSDSCSPS